MAREPAFRRLGGTGLKISPLILGTANFGNVVDDTMAKRIVHRAWDLGINTIDTAPNYPPPTGGAEEMVGRVIAGRRDQVVVMTKVGLRRGDASGALLARGERDLLGEWRQGISPNGYGLSRAAILSEVDASLERLGTDHIDVYQVHTFDQTTPIEETLQALDDLVRMGKVRYIGCSSFAAWQLYAALWASDRNGWARFATIQARYNLLSRDAETQLFPACEHADVGVIVFQALAVGLLTARYSPEQRPGPETRFGSQEAYATSYWHPDVLAHVERLRTYAASIGRTPAELAIGRVLAARAVNAVLVGADEPDHLDPLVAASQRSLSPEECDAIDQLASGQPA